MSRAVLGFVISALVARWLGPIDFGLFSLFIATMIIGNTLLGEGLDPSVVRFYAIGARKSPLEGQRVLSSALLLRLALGVPLVVLGWFGAPWIARSLLGDEIYAAPLNWGIMGAFVASLWSFTQAAFQAQENFRAYAMMSPLVNVLRIAIIPVLLTLDSFNLQTVAVSQVLAFLFCTLVGLCALRSHLTARPSGAISQRLFRFSQWTLLGNLFFILQVNLGVPLLSYFVGADVAGFYSAGATLLIFLDQLTVSILAAQFPGVSRLITIGDFRQYVLRMLPMYFGIALLLSPALLIAPWFVLLIYGPAYQPSVYVFQVLFVGFLVTLLTHPLYLVFYAINKPQLYTAATGISLIIWGIVAAQLIPSESAAGVAWASMAGRVVQGIVILLCLAVILRQSARSGGHRLVQDASSWDDQ